MTTVKLSRTKTPKYFTKILQTDARGVQCITDIYMLEILAVKYIYNELNYLFLILGLVGRETVGIMFHFEGCTCWDGIYQDVITILGE